MKGTAVVTTNRSSERPGMDSNAELKTKETDAHDYADTSRHAVPASFYV